MAGARRDAVRSAALARSLRSLKGVERAEVNPVTGNALIYYRGPVAVGERIVEQLRERLWVDTPARSKRARRSLAPPDLPTMQRRLAKAIVRRLAEAAIEHSLLALAAAVL